MDGFWGHKTIALFDVWSFEYFLSGISIGAITQRFNGKIWAKPLQNHSHRKQLSFYLDILTVLFLSFLWEATEHYFEVGLLGAKVEYWFQGVEAWMNRPISDPLLVLFGYLLSLRAPNFILYARLLSLTFLIIHIFYFPHSMYLHEIL